MPENLDWKPVEAAPTDLAWQPANPPAAPPSRLRRFVADPLISATKGAIALPEAAVGVADIVTGGYAGKAAEAAGFRPKEAKAVLDTLYSPEQQQANTEVAQAQGIVPTIKASFRNPSTIAHTVIESAPSILGSAGIARKLIMRGVPELAAAAAGEGVVSAGSTAEQVRQESPTGTITGRQALLSAGSGVVTSVLGAAGGKFAGSKLGKRLGIVDIDVAAAGGKTADLPKKNIAKAAVGGFAVEGAEEASQSAQETAAQNLATGKPVGEGVAKSAVLGAITGGAMGGGTSAAFNLAAKAAGVGAKTAEVKDDLDILQGLLPEEQKPAVEALAAQVHADDPLAAVAMQAQTLDKLDAGEPIIPAEPEKPSTPEAVRADLLESLAESVASGGEVNPLEVQGEKEVAKVLEALKVGTPTEPVKVQEGAMPGAAIPAAPVESVAEKRAQDWLKAGRVVVKEGKTPDAEVAALLDDMGYTLTQGERVDKTAGGSVRRREWRVEKKAASSISAPDFTGAGWASEEFTQGLEVAKEAIAQGNFDKVTTKKGGTFHLVHFDDGGNQGASRVLAFDEAGNLAGDLEYMTETMPDGRGYNPNVEVVEAFRRKGVASALYDAAEARGGKIPAQDQGGQLRTPDGEAFRAARAGISPLIKAEAAKAVPQGLTPIADGETRQAYADNPNLMIKRVGDKIALADKKSKEVLGVAHVKDGQVGGWVDGKEPATVAERAQILGVMQEHLGVEAPRFSAGNGTGLPASEVQSHLAPILKSLKVPVHVVNSASEVPGLKTDVKFNGVFHRGSIYLNAENLTSLQEAEEVLLKHELRHAGLRAVLGRADLDKLLAKAWGDLGSGVREFAQEKGIETKSREGKLEAAEEYIVELARTDGKSPLWDRFVELFKAALRKLGFDLKLSEAELRSLVVRAGEAMKVKGVESGETRFGRADEAGGTDAAQARSAWEKLGVESPYFKKWFGKSKVVDAVGKPLVVYHGTGGNVGNLGEFMSGDFSTFDAGLSGKSSKTGAPEGTFFFTDKPDVAGSYTVKWRGDFSEKYKDNANIMPTYVALTNPLKVNAKGESWREILYKGEYVDINEIAQAAKATGKYDGVIVSKVADKGIGETTSKTATTYIAFASTQIKSATGNRGTFDPNNPDIRYARVPEGGKAFTALTQKLDTQVAKRVLKDVSGNIWRAIMPVDRTIKMAQSMPLYAPIKGLLDQYLVQKRAKSAATDVPPTYAQGLRLEHEKAFKTEASLKAFNDLTVKATLYELHADGRNAGWSEKSWQDSGKEESTGKTLGEARAEIARLWSALTPEQRAVQQKIIEHMKVLFNQVREAQLEPLCATFGDEAFNAAEEIADQLWRTPDTAKLYEKHGAETMHLAEQIAAIKSEGHLKGDYAPLMRFGSHVVRTMEEGSEKRIKTEVFESKQAAIDAVNRIKAEPGVFPQYDTLTQGERNVVNIPMAFLDRMRAAAEARGLSGEALEALMDDFKAARLQTLPRTTLAGHGLKREGVEGYSTNMLRAYADYTAKAGWTVARLKYGVAIEQTFRDMNNAIKAYQDGDWDPHAVERMTTLKDNLYKLEMQHNAEKINELTKFLGKSTFLWYLSSPSVWAVQWSQPFMTTIPKMAARYGFGKAFAAYTAEAKRYLAGEFSDEKIEAFNASHENAGARLFALIEEERKALPRERAGLRKSMRALYDGFDAKDQRLLILKVLGLQGMLDLSSSHALQDLITGASEGQKMMDAVVNKGAFFMQKSETGSRRAAAVSSFQIALDAGRDFMEANDYAANIIDDTLADFSSQNRPGIMRGNVGRVVGQFQFFRLHMLGKIVQLAKDAYQEEGWGERRKELSYMIGMSMATAGAAGTPVALLFGNAGVDLAFAALALAFGDADDPWDPQLEFENAVRDALGEEGSTAFLRGLPALFGADISRRVGMGGLAQVISGEPPPGMTGTEKAQWYAGRILGPTFGIASDSMRALDALEDGDLGEAVAVSSPKVVKDFVKAYGLQEHGAMGAGGRTIIQPEEISPVSVALQLFGINPTEVALAQEERRDVAKLSTELRQRRSLLLKRVTEATLENDFDAREEALEGVNAWGLKNPGMKITQIELLEAVKRGRKARAGELSEREAALLKRVRGQE